MLKLYNDAKIGEVVSQGTAESQVYQIEARLKFQDNPPIKVGEMIVDGVWRHVRTFRSMIGVPNNLYDEQAKEHGYFDYDSAMALAYWFISSANRTAIEVRLIKYEFVSTHKVTKKEELTPIQTHYGI